MEITRTVTLYAAEINGSRDESGSDLLRHLWEEIRGDLKAMHMTGIVKAPYAAHQWDRLAAKYSEIVSRHPINLTIDRVRFGYGPSELASSELVDALPGYFVAMDDQTFRDAFHVRGEDGTSHFAEQVGVLKVPRRGLRMDFCAAVYQDRPVARIVSQKVRDTFEEFGADVEFKEILDQQTGRRVDGHFQMIVKRRIPFHRRTQLKRDLGFVGENRCPGTFPRSGWDLKREEPYLNYRHLLMCPETRDSELRGHESYFDQDAAKDTPVFLADQYLGVEYLLTDVQRPMFVSRSLCDAISATKPTGWIYSPAYLVYRDDPVAWGGMMVFMQERFINGTYRDWYHARMSALESALGKADTSFYSCRVPLHMGGEANVYTFREPVAGISYVTNDLIGIKAQQPNSLGHYELMLCMRDERQGDLAARLTSRLAHYDLDRHFKPGQAFDISSVVFTDSAITGVLFMAAETKRPMPEVRGLKAGLLLCIGITADELKACRSGRAEEVVAALKNAGHYPYTDFTRCTVMGR